LRASDDAWLGTNRARRGDRGRCNGRQQPQQNDRAALDEVAFDGSPQPRSLFHSCTPISTG
jgi:hypothetical protein